MPIIRLSWKLTLKMSFLIMKAVVTKHAVLLWHFKIGVFFLNCQEVNKLYLTQRLRRLRVSVWCLMFDGEMVFICLYVTETDNVYCIRVNKNCFYFLSTGRLMATLGLLTMEMPFKRAVLLSVTASASVRSFLSVKLPFCGYSFSCI